jgi:hypothetical protein
MTIGLTWRRTARKIKRFREAVLTISPDYSDRPTPDFLALSHCSRIQGEYGLRGGITLLTRWFSYTMMNQSHEQPSI